MKSKSTNYVWDIQDGIYKTDWNRSYGHIDMEDLVKRERRERLKAQLRVLELERQLEECINRKCLERGW